jgi:hypothetical protein
MWGVQQVRALAAPGVERRGGGVGVGVGCARGAVAAPAQAQNQVASDLWACRLSYCLEHLRPRAAGALAKRPAACIARFKRHTPHGAPLAAGAHALRPRTLSRAAARAPPPAPRPTHLWRRLVRHSSLLFARISVLIASNTLLTRSRSNAAAMANGCGNSVGGVVLLSSSSQ